MGPKLKSLFPHASLLTGWLWREGWGDYELISAHLCSLGSRLLLATKKKEGAPMSDR